MKFNDKQSVYSQIAADLKRKIYLGVIELAEALPSVRSLATDYQVTIKTIQNTLISLEEEGIVMKKSGVGTFVTTDKSKVEASKENYIKQLRDDFFSGMELIGVTKEEAIKYITGGVSK